MLLALVSPSQTPPPFVTIRPTKKTSEMDLKFERAAILFNMGSVKSHIAAAADRAQAEFLKVACKEFQVVANNIK